MSEEFPHATFAGGCFWCVEAAFSQYKSIRSIKPGYCGGAAIDPAYEEVCSGKTGHAEAVQFSYDPQFLSYENILEIFFSIHNPTQLNHQGPDVGSQYRSAIFYHTLEQKSSAESYIENLTQTRTYDVPIVTEIAEIPVFYEAEEYHHNYYSKNPSHPYCVFNTLPKIKKARSIFPDKLL